MRHFTLFTLVLTLLIGNVEAKSTDLFLPLKLLGIEYTVGKSPVVKDIGATRAVYSPRDDTIIVAPKEFFESKREYFHTILHELVHWSGSRADRAFRILSVDTFQEEVIAEVTAALLSDLLYEGRLAYSMDDVNAYLDRHPLTRQMEAKKIEEAKYFITQAYEYIMNELRKVDINNELELQLD